MNSDVLTKLASALDLEWSSELQGLGLNIGSMTSTGPDATSSTVIPPSSSTAPSPPLPLFPSPSCLPVSDGDFNVDYAIIAIGTFCTDFNQTVSAGSDPASQVFAGGPSIPSIRLTLSWNDTGSCPQKQFPAQNAGRDYNAIFHSIISGYKYSRILYKL